MGLSFVTIALLAPKTGMVRKIAATTNGEILIARGQIFIVSCHLCRSEATFQDEIYLPANVFTACPTKWVESTHI